MSALGMDVRATWWRLTMVSPVPLSLGTLACALAVHPWSGASLKQPISLELHALNPFAVLTLVGVAWAVLAMTRSFWVREYYLSAATGWVCMACLALIVAIDPVAPLHFAAFALLVILANALLFVWALDTLSIVFVLPPLAPFFVGPLAYYHFGLGGLQLVLIGSLLLALNLTTHHIV